jgi:hypothetical protein
MPLEQAPTLGELESAGDTARAVMAEITKAPEGKVADVSDSRPAPSPAEPKVDVAGKSGDATPASAAAKAGGKSDGERPDAGSRPRDAQGRFLAKDGTVDADQSEKPSTEAVAATPAAEPDVAADVPDELLEPLPEWSAADHEAFRALPVAQQKFILDKATSAAKREQDATAKATQYAAIEEILAPRREHLAINGLTDATYLKQLTTLSDWAARDKIDFARWFIQNRGITPEELWPVEGGQPQLDPTVAALQQRLDKFEAYFQNQQRTGEQSSQQQLQTELQRFESARNAQGQAEHPYFQQVRRHMGGLMGAGVAPDLKTAYDMACRADPEVSAKMASSQRAKDEAERARQNRAKAAAASKAGASVSGTPASPTPPDDSGDPRELMRRLATEKGLELRH